jgi:hypothetical protein
MALQSTTPLATVTLQQASNEVVFSGIPATYRDLILVVAGSSSGNIYSLIKFNSDGGSNYSWVRAVGTVTPSTASDSGTAVAMQTAYNTTNTSDFTFTANFMDYAQTDKHKTGLLRYSQGNNQAVMLATRWANTAAVNTISISTANNYTSGTTFSLYGRIA